MEIIIVVILIVLVIVYFARKDFMDNNSYNIDHTHNKNTRIDRPIEHTPSTYNDEKLKRLRMLSERFIHKSEEMANKLSEYGITPTTNSMMIDVANDWETITDLYLELGDKANSLLIIMGDGKKYPFPTFMFCMQNFLTEVQQAIEGEMRK